MENRMREKLAKAGFEAQAKALEAKEAQRKAEAEAEEAARMEEYRKKANEVVHEAQLFNLIATSNPGEVPDFTSLDGAELTYHDIIGLTQFFLSDPYGRKSLVAFFRYLIERFNPFFGKAFLGWYFTPPRKRREFRLDIKKNPDQLHLCLMGIVMVAAAETEDRVDYDQFYFHLPASKNANTRWVIRQMFATERRNEFRNAYYRGIMEQSGDLASTFLSQISQAMREALKDPSEVARG